MGVFVSSSGMQATEFTANLAQAAGTYDLCTATNGDILIDPYRCSFYMATAGATFTSVSIQTNQTNTTTLLTSGEGAVANLTAQKNVAHAIPGSQAFLLKSGQKLQYTIAGSTGTGSMTCTIAYFPVTSGATLA